MNNSIETYTIISNCPLEYGVESDKSEQIVLRFSGQILIISTTDLLIIIAVIIVVNPQNKVIIGTERFRKIDVSEIC